MGVKPHSYNNSSVSQSSMCLRVTCLKQIKIGSMIGKKTWNLQTTLAYHPPESERKIGSFRMILRTPLIETLLKKCGTSFIFISPDYGERRLQLNHCKTRQNRSSKLTEAYAS